MSEKLKSRKLWITVATLASVIIAEIAGVDIDPQALAGVAVIVVGYVFGQSLVDKDVITEEVKVVGDTSKQAAIAYARQLEAQLATFMESTEETVE